MEQIKIILFLILFPIVCFGQVYQTNNPFWVKGEALSDTMYIWTDTSFYMPIIKEVDTVPFTYFYEAEDGHVKVADGWIIRHLKDRVFENTKIVNIFDDYESITYLEYYYDKNWNPINCTVKYFMWKE